MVKLRKKLSICIKLTFCFTTLITISSTTVQRLSNSQSLNNIKVAWIDFAKYTERYFNGTAFHEQKVTSVAVCQRLCILNEACKSMNLLPSNNGLQCELFTKNFHSDPCKLERHTSATHYTISVNILDTNYKFTNK